MNITETKSVGQKWSEEEVGWLKLNYPIKGGNYCANYLGRKPKSIIKKTSSLKLRVNPDVTSKLQKESHRERNKKRIYSVNPKQFYNIQTPEVAYVLGLLWADGWIINKPCGHTVALACQLNDFNMFKPVFDKIGTWKTYNINRKNRKPAGEFKISNKPLVQFLMENDYLAKSSLSACKILSRIPDNLKHMWFRGFLDGDGHIGRKGKIISFCSSFEQDWTFLQKILDKNGLTYNIRRNEVICKDNGKIHRNSYFVLHVSSTMIFGNFIYKDYLDNHIGLPRKFEIYSEIKDIKPRDYFRIFDIIL
jgi:hypothetical protein